VKVKAEPKLAPISNGKEFFGKGKEKPKGAEISASSSKEGTPNPPNLKRENSSLFKSFAKAKPRIKKEETDSSAVVSATEDSPMKDVSDDEEETYEPEVASEAAMENDRKKRKEREAALKQMMEDDDDDDDTAPTPEPEPEEEQEAEVLEEIKDEEPKPDAVEVKEGRRRGRRRVMKKKNYKDEEGYLGIFHF
jgi:DNA polymerase delta subunit 3